MKCLELVLLSSLLISCGSKRKGGDDSDPTPPPRANDVLKKPTTPVVPSKPIDPQAWGQSLFLTTNAEFQSLDDTPTLNFIGVPKGSKILLYTQKKCNGEAVELKVLDSSPTQIDLPSLKKGFYNLSFKLLDGANQKVSPCADRELAHEYRPKSKPKKIIGTGQGFLTLREDGSVGFVGYHAVAKNFANRQNEMLSDVVDIAAVDFQMWVLKADGRVVIVGIDNLNLETKFSNIKKMIPMKYSMMLIDHNGKLILSSGLNNSVPEKVKDFLTEGIVDAVTDGYDKIVAIKNNGLALYFKIDFSGSNFLSSSGKEIAFSTKSAAIVQNGNIVTENGLVVHSKVVGPVPQIVPLSDIKEVKSAGEVFMALDSFGKVYTWSQEPFAQPVILPKLKKIYSNEGAFSGITENNKIVAWGKDVSGGNSSSVQNITNVKEIFSGKDAFFALTDQGQLVYWGNIEKSSELDAKLAANIVKLYLSESRYIALRNNGEVIEFTASGLVKNDAVTSSQISTGVKEIVFNSRAMSKYSGAILAIKHDGSYVTWGSSQYGGNTARKNVFEKGVNKIMVKDFKYFAQTKTGELHDIANQESNIPKFDSPVLEFKSNGVADIALLQNGKVVQWGGDMESFAAVENQLLSQVKKIYSNGLAFAALKTDGSIVTWSGFDNVGENINGVDFGSGVIEVYENCYNCFIAKTKENKLKAWGNTSSYLGIEDLPKEEVFDRVYALYQTFIGISASGKIFTWGKDPANDSLLEIYRRAKKIVGARIHSILTDQGNVVTVMNGVETNFSLKNRELFSNVIDIKTNSEKFIALTSDGKVLTWELYNFVNNQSLVKNLGDEKAKEIYVSQNSYLVKTDKDRYIMWDNQDGSTLNKKNDLYFSYIDPNLKLEISEFENSDHFYALDPSGKVYNLEYSDTFIEGYRFE